MTTPLHLPQNPTYNGVRDLLAAVEPRALRTFTPSLAVLARSAGIYHWTPEGRRLYDFTSGVLVANLGHNPCSWMKRFVEYMSWSENKWEAAEIPANGQEAPVGFFPALPLTA